MPLKTFVKEFIKSEDGAFSILSVYFVVIAAIMGGLAIDFQNRTTRETKLQAAADSVAHAALYSRSQQMKPQEARDAAMAVALNNLPTSVHGDAIKATDIEFGTWDSENAVFTVDENARDAVRVRASRTAARNNVVNNLLLHIVGYDGWDVEVESIFQIWEPPCFQNGFTAKGVVDTQSNNIFGSDFCMHANQHVVLSSNNTFYTGAVVSMPDTADLQLPQSGMDSNEGLADALRDGWYQFKVLNQLADANYELRTGGANYTPGYINGVATVEITTKKIDPTDLKKNRIHIKDCSTGGNTLTLEAGDYSGFVLVTDCSIKFNQGVGLEDAILFTEDVSAKSFSASSGLRIGKNDNCAAGGGVTLMTYGGFEVASDLEIYGSQIVAAGDVEFAANATGVQGVSIVAGGDIDTTSNIQMNGCPNQGDENTLVEEVMRMVR